MRDNPIKSLRNVANGTEMTFVTFFFMPVFINISIKSRFPDKSFPLKNWGFRGWIMISLTLCCEHEIPFNSLDRRGKPLWLIIIKERIIFFKPNIYLTLWQLKYNLDNFPGRGKCRTFVLLKDNNNEIKRVIKNSCLIFKYKIKWWSIL